MKTKFSKIALGVGLALGMVAQAQAAGVFFNSGRLSGGADNFKEVNSFDWAPGNFLSKASTNLPVGGTFTGYYQAELTKITYTDGSFDNIPVGPNGPFEITAAGVINEQILSLTDANADGFNESATFKHLGGTFDIYFDNFSGGTTNADGVIGNSGLGYQDGADIFSANVLPSPGVGASYNNFLDLPTIGLDQNAGGGDQDGGTTTYEGIGTSNLRLQSNTVSALWWLPSTPGSFISSLLLTTLNNPFATINPETSVLGQTPTHLGGRPGDTFNGVTLAQAIQCAVDPTAPQCHDDFQFLADSSQNFQANVIPEPEQISLLGIGLAAMGFAGRRRKVA